MSAVSPTFPLMQFYAGELRCGVVAEAIERLSDAEPSSVRLCDLLRVPPVGRCEARTLHLSAYGQRGRVTVEGPTAMGSLQASQLIPTSRSLRSLQRGPILGFARAAEHLVFLLDVAWLLERAS